MLALVCLLVFWVVVCIVAMVKVDFRGGLHSYVCGSLLLGFAVAVWGCIIVLMLPGLL